MDYDLELDKAVTEIRKTKARSVLVQLPDGLKPRAAEIVDKLETETGARILIWQASCFGACDTPDVKGVDLLIQWGHSRWGIGADGNEGKARLPRRAKMIEKIEDDRED